MLIHGAANAISEHRNDAENQRYSCLQMRCDHFDETMNETQTHTHLRDDVPSVGVALATCSTEICSACVVSSCKMYEEMGIEQRFTMKLRN